LPCLAVSDRVVESIALATTVVAGVPIILVWGIGAGIAANWRMALEVAVALWCGAVGFGSWFWLRWIDGRRLSKAALMAGTCATYGAEVLMALGFGSAGLSERGVAWAIAACGAGVAACSVALRAENSPLARLGSKSESERK
jgi:predicted permease